MIIQILNSAKCTRELLHFMNEFNKVVGYKKNTQLYNHNEQAEKEIEKVITLTISSKRINYLSIKLI